MSFETAWAATGRAEGGYSDHPSDRGGPTNHGITEAVARANGYSGDMRDLSADAARAIAKRQYWDVLRLDDIDALSPAIAAELFDTGFNMGQAVAGRFLQRALNALNGRGRIYGDLGVDGLVGPVTVAALRSYLARREDDDGERVMLRLLNCLQGARYLEITEAREANEDFLHGWLRTRVEV